MIVAGFFLFSFIQYAHIEAIVDDEGVRLHAVHNEHIAANGAVRADDSFAAEDGGTGINGHMILNGRMPFGAGELLAAGSGSRTERYAVVKLHVIANLAGFSDHRAGAVIDKK